MTNLSPLAAVTVLLVGASAPAPKGVPKDLSAQGPLDFRCDGMQVHSKPNRTVCSGNVVVRRSDVVLCCQEFEGIADEHWQWQRLLCKGDVRAQRGEETMWAEQAEFMPGSGDLVLTGHPSVKRGASLILGDEVAVNINEDRARIKRPRGRIAKEEQSGKPLPTAGGKGDPQPLPASCPVPARR